MKRKFYDGQLVRVIGDERCFFVGCWGVDGMPTSSKWYENSRDKKWWPEYLLESAE